MISPEKIEAIKRLMQEANLSEHDLQESFIMGSGPGGQKTNKTSSVVRFVHQPTGISVKVGQTRSRETNRFLARRQIAELILEKISNRKTAAQQAREKIRRQKRRRSRKQKEKMLEQKHARSEIKALRRKVEL
jgi:protein subunit release factor B